MIRKNMFFVSIVLIPLITLPCFAKDKKTVNNKTIHKVSSVTDMWFDINRMNGIYRNNGICLHDAYMADRGLEWPKGSGNYIIFAMGPWITAKINTEICVAPAKWDGTNFQPGQIIETDLADDYLNSDYRWYDLYKVGKRPDGSNDDYLNWPVNQGAPTDESGNPLYIGDRSSFCVYNDLKDFVFFPSAKLNLEVCQYIFGFDMENFLQDTQFIKWRLINKSGIHWDSTYFSIWIDPDIGNANDDFIGCDTTKNLAYCYNSINNDDEYGTAPPAVGIIFLQGPVMDNPDKSLSLPDGTNLTGKEMLNMSSFVYWYGGDSPQGDPYNPEHVWAYLKGQWKDHTPITEGDWGTDPENPPTKFMYSGEPETGTGWIDNYADDRTFLMSIGPFEMAAWNDIDKDSLAEFGEPGVQEIIIAVIACKGENNLNSVTRLKLTADSAKQVYQDNFYLEPVSIGTEFGQIPAGFSLDQNYPNPFNPVTRIDYTIGAHRDVPLHIDLSIYNILGQKVVTLVSERQSAGEYQVQWDASEFAAGIYFYKMRTEDGFVQTKKLILLK